MMHVNFNRSVNFSLIMISLIATGCSETSTAPLSTNDYEPAPLVYPKQGTNNAGRLHSNRSLTKTKHKSGLTQKNTVWNRLVSLYSLPEVENERIDRAVEWYLRHPDSLAAVQERAAPYMHLILNEIEAKNIPGELALLPVVESSFRPNAYSRSDASGLWQFIPSTGRLFGLKQNDWYDGRRDILLSTKAATTYLKQLSETFDGDWLLALASYNYGKGNIAKSIERNEDNNLPTDYWSLNLPEETENYVPKLLAIAKVFANAEEYDIPLKNIPDKPYCELIDVKSQIDLSKAAELARTPLDEFLKLNPGFNRASTAPDGPHQLLVPTDKAQAFKKNLAQLSADELVDQERINEERIAQIRRAEEKAAEIARRAEEREEKLALARRAAEEKAAQALAAKRAETKMAAYKVKPGESLTAIANRNQTTIGALKQANHLASLNVRSGMVLQVPANKAANNIPFINKSTVSKGKEGGQFYAVKKGDTYFNIAQRYSVSPKNIADWNKITLKTALVPGMKLAIKGGEAPLVTTSAAESNRLINYTVKPGDSLMQISRKFSVPVSDLRKWNSSANSLTPGKKIKVLVNNNHPT